MLCQIVSSLAAGIRSAAAHGCAVGPSASGQLVWVGKEHNDFCLYSFLMPHAHPFQANQAWAQCSWWVGLSLCSNHKLIFRVVPFLVILWLVISYCYLWACTDLHSSFPLIPVYGSLWCQLDPHNWASETPSHSLSWQGFGQPTQSSDLSNDIPRKLTLWQLTPKVLPSWWARPPWVLLLPV